MATCVWAALPGCLPACLPARSAGQNPSRGTAAGAAVQELLEQERRDKAVAQHAAVDVDDLLNDPDLEALHEQRVAELRAARETRAAMTRVGHGAVTDLAEGDFLTAVTQTKRVVAHFQHRDFPRCAIMDKHLQLLAPKYFETRFVRLHAPDAPFFVAKLNVQVLPCVLCFVDGIALDRVVGFDELGAKDDFATDALEARLAAAGALGKPSVDPDAAGDEPEQRRVNVRKGFINAADGDEDSDFGD